MSGFNVSGIITLRDAFSATAARVGASAQALKGQLAGVQAQGASMGAAAGKGGGFFGLTGVATAAIAGVAAIGYTAIKAVTAFAELEDAMADVRKNANLSKEETIGFMTQITKLSMSTRTAAVDLADLASTGAQLGIAKEDLMGFVDNVNKIGVAFDISSKDAASYFGKIKNAMGLTLPETYKLADAMNTISNNTGASAAEIARSLTVFGATAKMMNMTTVEASALAATLIETGRMPELVGRGLNNILPVLGTLSRATDDAQESILKMGLSIKDIEAEAVVNPLNALMNVLKGINTLSPNEKLIALKNIFGQQWADDVNILASNFDKLQKNVGMVDISSKFDDSVLIEYNNKMDTLSASWDTLGNKFSALMVRMGTGLSPVANAIVQALSSIVDAIDWVMDKFSALSSVMSGIGSGISSALGAFNFTNATGPSTGLETAANSFITGKTDTAPQTVNVQGTVTVKDPQGRTLGRAPVTKVGTNGAGRASSGGDVAMTGYGY